MTSSFHETAIIHTEVNPARRSFLARAALLPLQAAKRGLDEFFAGMGMSDATIEPLGADAQFVRLSGGLVPQPRMAEQELPSQIELEH